MGWYITDGPAVGYWVAAKNNGQYHAESSVAIGLVRNDKIVAGVIYEDYNGKSVVVHIAITGRLTPQFVKAICEYAFITCKVNKAIAPVSSANVKSIKFVENMGFIEEGRIRDAAPDGDIIMYTLGKDTCRFINYGR